MNYFLPVVVLVYEMRWKQGPQTHGIKLCPEFKNYVFAL